MAAAAPAWPSPGQKAAGYRCVSGGGGVWQNRGPVLKALGLNGPVPLPHTHCQYQHREGYPEASAGMVVGQEPPWAMPKPAPLERAP
jgi:hypothetical protein